MDMNSAPANQETETAQQSSPTNLPELSFHETLGIMLWLCNQADYHKTWPLWAVDNDLVPPLIHRQFRIYFDEQQNPVGFVTWAWLDDAEKQQVLNGEILDVKGWRSGNQLLCADFVAPWGHAKTMFSELRREIFPDQKEVFGLRRNLDGSVRKIAQLADYRRSEVGSN